MALVFADGFDHYTAADILKMWTGYLNNSTITTSILPSLCRPPGGQGLQLTDGNNGRGVYRTLPATYATFVSGFSVYFTTVPGSAAPFWAVYDSTSGLPAATYQLELRGDGAGHLRISRNGTTLATSTTVLSTSTWYHIEIKATINNSTGAYEVKVNGSSTGWIPAATSQNTRGQSANNYIDIVALASAAAASNGPVFDDFYFLSSTAPNNDFVGPQKYWTAYAAGIGTHSEFTGNYATNYANVNEITGDSDNTFNQSATADQIDTFLFDHLPAGTITAVQHVLMVKKDAGAARTIAPVTRTGGDTDREGTTLSVAGSYQFLTDPMDVDPATSAAWDVDDFNGYEYGYVLKS